MKHLLTLNKISPEGLDIFDKNKYVCRDDIEKPDAIMVRSASMHEMELPASLKALALNDDIREIDTDADMIRWFVSDDEHLTFPSRTRLVNGEEVVYEPEED